MTNSSAASRSPEQLKRKIEQRQARVAMIGLGYVGLPLALLFSEQSLPSQASTSTSAKLTPSPRAAPTSIASARKRFRQPKPRGSRRPSDYSQLAEMDAIIICVPTPLNQYHEPDLSFITDTTHAIAPHLQAGQLVVLGEHNLSRHHGGSDAADSGKGEQEWTEGRPRRIRGARRNFSWRFLPSVKIQAIPAWRGVTFPRWWVG